MKTLVSFALIALFAAHLPAGVGDSSDSVVKISAKLERSAAGKTVAVIELDVKPGWHLYANPAESELYAENAVVVKGAGPVDYPPGKAYVDEQRNKVKVYQGKIRIRAAVAGPAPVELSVDVQACSDGKGSVCLTPATVKVTAR